MISQERFETIIMRMPSLRGETECQKAIVGIGVAAWSEWADYVDASEDVVLDLPEAVREFCGNDPGDAMDQGTCLTIAHIARGDSGPWDRIK